MHQLLDEVERLVRDGFAQAAVDLAEHALGQVEAAYGCIDDSDGEIGSVQVRAEDIHLEACEASELDPVQLGTIPLG
jgi:hypothetical protein